MEFISERLQPKGEEFALPPAVGEPALPLRFLWRGAIHEVRQILRRWKGEEPDRTHGGSEHYMHRHWYELAMDDATVWTLYFLRHPGSRRSAKARWWIYGVDDSRTR